MYLCIYVFMYLYFIYSGPMEPEFDQKLKFYSYCKPIFISYLYIYILFIYLYFIFTGPMEPSDDQKLKFYSYYKQANFGQATEDKKPGFFDFVGKAKW